MKKILSITQSFASLTFASCETSDRGGTRKNRVLILTSVQLKNVRHI